MSWSIYAKFCTKGIKNELTLIDENYIDRLKILSNTRYAIDFDNEIKNIYLANTSNFEQYTNYVFYDYIDKDFFANHKDLFELHDHIENSQIYVIKEDSVIPVNAKVKPENDHIIVYKNEQVKENYYWYNIESFSSGLKYYENQIDNLQCDITRLHNLMLSLDFYKLTDEQKSNVDYDLNDKLELKNDYKDKAYACNFIISLLDYFSDKYNSECVVGLTAR